MIKHEDAAEVHDWMQRKEADQMVHHTIVTTSSRGKVQERKQIRWMQKKEEERVANSVVKQVKRIITRP
jgi:hypothetical protein